MRFNYSLSPAPRAGLQFIGHLRLHITAECPLLNVTTKIIIGKRSVTRKTRSAVNSPSARAATDNVHTHPHAQSNMMREVMAAPTDN